MSNKLLYEISKQERVERKIRFRVSLPRRIKFLNLALNKTASAKTLQKRAKNNARRHLKLFYLGKSNLNKVSFSDRERVENYLRSKKTTINNLSKRLLPVVKKLDFTRHDNV